MAMESYCHICFMISFCFLKKMTKKMIYYVIIIMEFRDLSYIKSDSKTLYRICGG